ncbi:hypothetical protein D3C81_1961930 [compost metagenome]
MSAAVNQDQRKTAVHAAHADIHATGFARRVADVYAFNAAQSFCNAIDAVGFQLFAGNDGDACRRILDGLFKPRRTDHDFSQVLV